MRIPRREFLQLVIAAAAGQAAPRMARAQSYPDRPELAWEHVWRVSDLVLWDNRCTMHRRDAFDPTTRRIMHRTQVMGETRPA